ncbi:hypothetical protein [Allocoleopsis sp.]
MSCCAISPRNGEKNYYTGCLIAPAEQRLGIVDNIHPGMDVAALAKQD